MVELSSRWSVRRAVIWATAFATGVLGDDLLVTTGFTNCEAGSAIEVQKVDIQYNNNDKTVVFDIAGTSSKEQNVTATLSVTAYGEDVYTNSFNPCDATTFVDAFCPMLNGPFGAKGSQPVPPKYANSIPAIAFQVPDIAALATLELKALDDGSTLGCIKSQVTNRRTADVPAVPYLAAGVAGAAMMVTGVTAVGAAFSGGTGAASSAGAAGHISPSFGEVFGVFQGFAMNGMMSVQMPQVYRSFSKNFAFSTGLIPWDSLEVSIDNFRAATGGNLTNDSVQFLRNATLVYPDGSITSGKGSTAKRALEGVAHLARRQATVTTRDEGSATETSIRQAVSGIQAYAQQLTVPKSNTFMTALLIVAIVIAVVVVGILLVKVVLEVWALYGNFPQSLAGFRKHYWGSIARAVTSLIFLLYGIWVLYCIYQFTHGDSWAAKALAGFSLAIFTGILAFFSWKIWTMARKLKNTEGDVQSLYEDKKLWVKYSLFYESYKKDYWWIFIPLIAYLFVKGAVMAATDGHGMAQAICLLIVEGLMLGLLVWSKPFERKSGNIINITIQAVRFLSVVCVFVFVEEFGIKQTTQTVTGMVLIVVQSTLAGVLAILIAWNAIVHCCKENPHRKRRKEMEKQMQRDMDTLTPLDARNSLLMLDRKADDINTFHPFSDTKERRNSLSEIPNPYAAPYERSVTPVGVDQSRESLVSHAAPFGQTGNGFSNGGYGYRAPGGY
ncbi:TRP-domain-containing protein [Xylariaceae sp. FL0662B]|nr:TRP-domain-containing protein [Xylariaceae sp. FL0662B]